PSLQPPSSRVYARSHGFPYGTPTHAIYWIPGWFLQKDVRFPYSSLEGVECQNSSGAKHRLRNPRNYPQLSRESNDFSCVRYSWEECLRTTGVIQSLDMLSVWDESSINHSQETSKDIVVYRSHNSHKGARRSRTNSPEQFFQQMWSPSFADKAD